VDARSVIPPGYVERCATILAERPDVAVVGGAQVTVARSGAPRDVGIARALNNRWGMGLARYRRDGASGPSDTVYLGAFRTAELRAAGGWDPRFPTNQDFELNQRMGREGIVWYESGMDVGYLPRPGVVALFRQYHRFGRWKVRYWRRTGERPLGRQALLLAVPFVGVAGLGWWLVAGARTRVALLAAGAGGVAVFEALGSAGPPGPPAAHGWSLAASAAVGAGWTSGVWREVLPGVGRTSA
jgi:hypothetical protein